MEHTKIPATVSILTRNSGVTLSRALESVQAFAEILVADGGSTDNTLELAHAAGARVIAQNKLFQDADGRLKDWSGVRNECLDAATYPWHFYVDSDEYAGEALIDEIRKVVGQGIPGAFWVPRKYVAHEVVIERSLGYPNQQVRLFHRDAVVGFRKPIHERIEFEPDVLVQHLHSPLFVPAEMDIVAARAKIRRYIDIELARQAPVTHAVARRLFWSAAKTCIRYIPRFLVLCVSRGPRLPIALDLLPVEYQIRLAAAARARLRS